MFLSVTSGILVTICESISLLLLGLIERYLQKKPEGLRTPLDQGITDTTRVWNARTIITDICFFSGLLYGQISNDIALSLLFIQCYLFYLMISSVQMTLVLKVIMIFKGQWVNDLMDEEISWIFRAATLGYAGLWWGIDFMWAKPRPRFLLTLMTGSNSST